MLVRQDSERSRRLPDDSRRLGRTGDPADKPEFYFTPWFVGIVSLAALTWLR